MKNIAIVLAAVLGFILIVLAGLFAMRAFNEFATPVNVHRPEPGIVCVSAVTSDGVAISCLRDEK